MEIAEHLIPVDCTDVTIVGMVSGIPTTIRPKRTTMIPNIHLGAVAKPVSEEMNNTNNICQNHYSVLCCQWCGTASMQGHCCFEVCILHVCNSDIDGLHTSIETSVYKLFVVGVGLVVLWMHTNFTAMFGHSTISKTCCLLWHAQG